MARNIYCRQCGAYLGEIRDATLARGIEYVCRECARPKPTRDIPDFMRGIFGGAY